MQVKNKTRIF